MIHKPARFIFLGLVFIALLISAACGGGAAETTAAPVETQAPAQATTPPEPTAEEQPIETGAVEEQSGALDKISEAEKAVIQIEAVGTFVDPEVGVVPNAAGRGSGFIISPDGLAVTNNHVVTGSALLKVWVGGDQSKTYNAKVLGVSECSDLAVIDIEGDGFDFVDWFDGAIEVGQEIYVAGFPLGDPEYSLTKGIISKAKADGETSWASVDSVIEYDANTNPGNSGGPVLTEDAKVVGVHYAGNSSTRQAFGISRDIAQGIIEDLAKGENQDWIGINGQAVSNEDGSLRGVWVSSVQSGSPADKAGVQGGDILLNMENLDLASDYTMADYCDILRSHKASDTLNLTVLRWASGEVLEGQLNGRELAVVSSLSSGNENEEANTNTDSNTNDDSNTNTSSGGEAVVNENASQSGEIFYAETFEGEISNLWEYFLTSGSDSNLTQYVENGNFTVEIDGGDTYVYFLFKDWTFDNPRLDVRVTNKGVNTNFVGLFCRYSDQGWYEAYVQSSGVYSFYYVDQNYNYTQLWEGGSRLVTTGKATNEYTLICDGNTMTLGINGTEVKTLTLTGGSYPLLTEGQVGITVSSGTPIPVIVDIEEFYISVP
jgi:S1-C subfamily serine protease